jgi:hypothetical protein
MNELIVVLEVVYLLIFLKNEKNLSRILNLYELVVFLHKQNSIDMKKILLTLAVAVTGFAANSQVIFSVEEPTAIAGNYNLTFAPNTDWGVPDMIDPTNAVLDTLMLASDGTAADSLMCTPAAAGSLTGKIAVLYRGSCQFGTKSYNAQLGGAIAVIIINNTTGEPVGMAGGDDGMNVTIPVIMVSDQTGAVLKSNLEAGTTVVGFIGNKTGYYPNDLGSNNGAILTPRFAASPAAINQNASEFSFNTGAWIYNYGFNDATGVTVTATVERGGTNLYTQTSAPANIPASDSLYVTFTTPFSESTYPIGTYTLTYTMSSDSVDSYAFDNAVVNNFNITQDVYSLARLTNGVPTIDGGLRPSNNNNSYSTCIVFRNANANRLAARGIHFSASKNAADGAITDEEIIISAYRWNDNFASLAGVTDVATIFQDLQEVASGSFFYTADESNVIKYAAFTSPVVLENNQRYLFCATTTNTTVFLGYDTRTKYELLEGIDLQPTMAIESDGSWFLGFNGGDVPAIAADLMPAAEVSTFETSMVEANSFPNPAKDKITIQVAGFNGDANVTVSDLAGKVVMTESVNVINGQFNLNVNGLNSGMYIFNMSMNDGKSSKFNVVVNK